MWKCWLIGFGWSKRNPTWLDWFILLHMNRRQQSRGSKHRTELYLFATNLSLSLSLKIEDICYACESARAFLFSRGRLEACELCNKAQAASLRPLFVCREVPICELGTPRKNVRDDKATWRKVGPTASTSLHHVHVDCVNHRPHLVFKYQHHLIPLPHPPLLSCLLLRGYI